MTYRDLDDVDRMLDARGRARREGGGDRRRAARPRGRGRPAGARHGGRRSLHLMGHLMERQLDPLGRLPAAAGPRAPRHRRAHCKAQTKAILGHEPRRGGAARGRHGLPAPTSWSWRSASARDLGVATDADLEVNRGIVVDDAHAHLATRRSSRSANASSTRGIVLRPGRAALRQARVARADAARRRRPPSRRVELSTKLKVTGMRPLLRRRLRRGRGPRGDRVPRRRARRLQAAGPQGRPDHRRGDVRRHRRRRLVLRQDQGARRTSATAATR